MMKRSTSLVAFLSVVVFLAVGALARAQGRFQHVYQVHVKPGYEQVYENYLKKVVEAANKIGSPMTWATFDVPVGKTTPTYRIALSFDEWAERDRWEVGRSLVVKAFGDEEGKRIWDGSRKALETSSSRIWERLDDGSSNVTSGGQVANFYEVTIREVKREMLYEFRSLQRKFKAAYEASDSKPVVSRSVQRFGESTNATFRRAAPFNQWADRDELRVLEILRQHYGPEEQELMINTMNRCLVRQETFVSRFRPELSRAQGTGTTSEE